MTCATADLSIEFYLAAGIALLGVAVLLLCALVLTIQDWRADLKRQERKERAG